MNIGSIIKKKNGMGHYLIIGMHPYKDGFMVLSNPNTAIFLPYYVAITEFEPERKV